MRIDLIIIAVIAACGVGFMAFWSNPKRGVNRAFLTLSLHTVAWLLSLRAAFILENGLLWYRTACAVGALIPLHLWFIKETMVSENEGFFRMLGRSRYWGIAAVTLAATCFTLWFIPTAETAKAGATKIYGTGHAVYMGGIFCAYATLSREVLVQLRTHTGIRRLELQIVLLGGSVAAVTVMVLMVLNAVFHLSWLIRTVQPLVVIGFYIGTTIAITTHRIFNARQLVVVGAQKMALVTFVAGGAYLADAGFGLVLPEAISLFATTAIALWFASVLNGWLDRMWQFYPQATAARQAAFTVAQRETRMENLEKAFLSVLRGWGQTDYALILSGAKDALSGGGIDLSGDPTMVVAMRHLRWVTPERLARERPTPERQKLGQFLTERGLGALVIGEGPSLTALIGVGVGGSRRPFTYPQVTQLMELASIIEGALERAHFSAKVQHAEQLATVGVLGASLAHEIRNPLVSIKTFVQLLPTHYQDPAFRAKFFRLIGDEVTRIDQLTEQLLDLSSPRVYTAELIELHPVLRATIDLVAAKATDKQIELRTDFQAVPDSAFTDASAAKQVMLNLCFNAIQAVDAHGEGERWVRVATRNIAAGLEMVVADSGPGIAEEIRPRLFQPFQTTKSTGFGLGLAICGDILGNLNASITVDPPEPGHGAVFRVIFPCQPLSS